MKKDKDGLFVRVLRSSISDKCAPCLHKQQFPGCLSVGLLSDGCLNYKKLKEKDESEYEGATESDRPRTCKWCFENVINYDDCPYYRLKGATCRNPRWAVFIRHKGEGVAVIRRGSLP